MKLSLICPHIGRENIMALLERVVPQLKPGDEFIIASDGPLTGKYAEDVRLVPLVNPQVKVIELPVRVGDWGCTPIDTAIKAARGDAVFFIGDDDMITENAFSVVRAALRKRPDEPHIFAMLHTGRVLKNTLARCHVSNQQLVIPRNMERMPKMAGYEPDQALVSDWVFITKVVASWGGRVVYHDDIIAILEKQNYGAV